MISLGLTAAQQREFHAVLAGSYSVDIVVRVMDLNRRYLADISERLYDGQVNVDGDADITRTATLSLRDPDHALLWDTNSPSDGSLFVDRLVSILYVITAPYPARLTYSVPIFAGPVTKASRTADVVNVEASGMEHLVLPPTVAWFTKTYNKGVKKSTLVRTIMSELGTETKFQIPDWPETTAAPVTLVHNSNIWAVAKSVVGSRATNHLFYDGRGVCVLRKTPYTSTFAFRSGDGGTIITEPQVNYDMADVRNTVRVVGAVPTGKKTPVSATVTAPRSHPLSTFSLGRNGRQRVILEEVEDDHLKTAAQCKELAQSRVDWLLQQSVDVTFDARVVPHLEPEDVYTIHTPDFSFTARVKRLTIPLKSGPMSVGYNVKRSTNAARIRKR